MPLLAKPTPPSVPTEFKIRGQVSQLKAAPRRLADQLVKGWSTEFDRLWDNKEGLTPAQMLTGLGPDAAELFAANAALTTFLITMLTGQDNELIAEIQAKVATIPAFTVHVDGTVTLD